MPLEMSITLVLGGTDAARRHKEREVIDGKQARKVRVRTRQATLDGGRYAPKSILVQSLWSEYRPRILLVCISYGLLSLDSISCCLNFSGMSRRAPHSHHI